MDGNIAIVISLVFLVGFSAFFSASETAFSSLNHIRIKILADDGNKRAALVLDLMNDFDRLLSTILIGNNIVNIVSTSLATVVFVAFFAEWGVTLSTVVMTVAVLIFGEITPKSLAKENPEKVALAVARPLRLIRWLLTPLVFVFVAWKKLIMKFVHSKNDSTITEEEILNIVDEAKQDGGLGEDESNLIRSAIEFGDTPVSDILVPRVDVAAVGIDDSIKYIGKVFEETGFSRLPVYEDSVDNIIGIIHHKDFSRFVKNNGKRLKRIIKPTVYVAETIHLNDLLKLLQQSKEHMAVVVDEYGGTVGIATMEDILEELVGEIWDEHDEVEEDIIEISPCEYSINGSLALDEMLDYFGIEADEEAESTSVGGFAQEQLGKIPVEGDSFDYENLHITVTEVDQRRVMKIDVLVSNAGEQQDNNG